MSEINKVFMQGTIANEPERRATKSGLVIAMFLLRNTRRTQSGEEESCYDCKVFGKTAEQFLASFGKGAVIIITGRLSLEKWISQKDGQEKSRVSVIVDDIEPISKPPQQPQYQPAQAQYQQPPYYQQRNVTPPMQAAINQAANESVPDDDIPF
jgi:single-strand DNA-binding protein